MRRLILSGIALAALSGGIEASAQQAALDRLPAELLDVVPPSERVSGAPGEMRVRLTSCQGRPAGEIRRRIVDVAVQEWAFFGFSISDQTAVRNPLGLRQDVSDTGPADRSRARGRFRGLGAEESARVADSIAGYWAVTPDGAWILDRQNEAWSGPRGIASRWRDPWSAAFISWVMCEAGLASSRFQRAIAHHVYIDQAIRARDGAAPQAAFAAYDPGETSIEPGDLLCSARRPGYSSIADRRRQLGDGARTHCDVVVKVDEAGQRILAIGGNVRSRVSMKVLPAVRAGGRLRPRTGLFAHLKLRAEALDADALDSSPTMKTVGCTAGFQPPAQLAAAILIPAPAAVTRC